MNMKHDFNPVAAMCFTQFDPRGKFNPYDLTDLLTNLILNTDSYKLGHYTFEPQNITYDYGYIEARKGGDYQTVTFFGLQYFLLYYMTRPITMEMIDDAEVQVLGHGLPFNRKGWELILSRHGGYLPVRIRAVREGETVPHGCVQVTIESTDEELIWAVRYVETALLRGVWFPSTIAERQVRWNEILDPFIDLSGSAETKGFKIVDFGSRGATSTETSALAGAACQITSLVTDNQIGMRMVRKVYAANDAQFIPAFSIPATEHSVTTSWGPENEYAFFENILNHYGSKPRINGQRNAVSVVIDTYDQDQALAIWGTNFGQPLTLEYIDGRGKTIVVEKPQGGLKKRLRESNMKLVARPDSGDPVTNVVHVLNLLGELFGYTMNDKGFKMLPDYVGVIQGDSINEVSLKVIAQAVIDAGWSIDNVNFGSGGGLLQQDVTRDAHRYAQKSSFVVVDGKERGTAKLPKTDPTKASKAGRFSVVRRNGVLTTIPLGAALDDEIDLLEVVYEDGVVKRIMTMDQIRIIQKESRALYRAGIAA